MTDTYTVTGQDTTGVAEGLGALGYSLVVLNDAEIGEEVEFEVRPHNPDLVTADVKHCKVKRTPTSTESVYILGDGTDQNDKCTRSPINSGLTIDSGKIISQLCSALLLAKTYFKLFFRETKS